jgi:outer membrane protein assembly factor BamB
LTRCRAQTGRKLEVDPQRLKRRARYIVIAIPLLGLLLSACVPQSRGSSAITVEDGIIYAVSPEGNVLALDPQQRLQRWQAEFPTGGREWISPAENLGVIYARPLPSGDRLFVATFDGKVWVLSRGRGDLQGEEPLFEDESLVATPALAGNTLLIAAGSELYAIDAATGVERWARPAQAQNRIWASPVLLGDRVIFASLDRRLYAVKLDTGEELWSFEAGGGIASTPLVVDSTIYFGSFDGHLYAIGSDGREVWSSPVLADEWVWSRPLFYEGTVYFGALDGVLYAVDAIRGRVRWSEDLGEPIRAAPALEEGVVVVATTGGTVYGMDPGNGTQKWEWPLSPLDEDITVSAELAGHDGEVYVVSEQGTLYALDAGTGKLAWRFSLTEVGE